MQKTVKIGTKKVGADNSIYIIGEIGINHNGSVEIAKQLIDLAVLAGCDAVKFQKRTPSICVPKAQRDQMRNTPWGLISYMDYRNRIEFGLKEYKAIDSYCRKKNIDWFASCWDIPSVDFIERFKPACYKIASASVTDIPLLKHIRTKKRPVILSTGMSTMNQITKAVKCFDQEKLIILHSTSSYPCRNENLNLRMIHTLEKKFKTVVGYSGHEVGLQTTLAAAAIGAKCIERHITLDRTLWGSDQAASVESSGLIKLVRDIRVIEKAMGDGVKKVYPEEKNLIERLRKVVR